MINITNLNEKIKQIEILNAQIKICNNCCLSSGRTYAICGEGNLNSRIFFIAQAPGEAEDRDNKMFVGPTGAVMNELFREANIKRGEVYMTNLIKCRLPKNRKPKQNEIDVCGLYLENEIAIINPEFLIPMGYHATKYIFSRYCKEYTLPSDPAGNLFYCNGIKVYSLHHPSSVLYNPSFRKISVFQTDCKWYPVCPIKMFYEEGKLERKWIELFCKGDWESCIRYQMEENSVPHPDNMLPDDNINKKL
jgi:uracil-DNA glycosylase family 4